MQPFNSTGGTTPLHAGLPSIGASPMPLNLPPPPATPAATAPAYSFGYQANPTPPSVTAPFASPFGVSMGAPGFPLTMPQGMANIDPSMLMTMASMFMPNMGNLNVPQPPEQARAPAESNTEQQSQTSQSLWREHRTAEGRIFWHNTKNGKSTWDKPDELKTDLEKVLATSTNWREYPGGDGKTYWHNLETKQSEWEVPQEVREIQEKMAQLAAEDWSGRKFDGKVQAKAEFRLYLERRGIGHKARWEDVGKIIQSDKKWNVFDSFLTSGERKHVFNEFVNQLQKRHREEQRAKKAEARDALAEYLSKWRTGESGSLLTPSTSYEEFVEKASGESWFHLLDAADKAEAFEEVAQATADEACKRPSKQKTEELLQFFQDIGDTELSVNTPAEGVVELVKSSFDEAWLATMPPITILNIWQRYVMEKPDSMRQKTKQELYRQERKAREQYRAMLKDAEEEGLLDAKSEWSDFLNGPTPKRTTVPPVETSGDTEMDKIMEKVQARVKEWVISDLQRSTEMADGANEEEGVREEDSKEQLSADRPRICTDLRYLRLFFQGGSTPKEMFEDFVYELWDIYEELRPILKKYLTSNTNINTLLGAAQLPSADEFAAAVEAEMEDAEKAIEIDSSLWKAAKRPGVLNPLILSLAKKLRRSAPEENNT